MGHSRTARVEVGLAHASTLDTTRVITTVVLPLVARGVLLRRPQVVALAERLDADRRAVHLLQRLRTRYGPGPLRLRVPGRSVALVLSPEGVHRVLSGSPEPFAVANREKRGALSHFQPHGVLVSHGQLRAARRRVNEEVLDFHRPMHRLAEAIAAKVVEEARPLLPGDSLRSLSWDEFATCWWRAVRRVVLGDAARNDYALTDLLARLRAHQHAAGARKGGSPRSRQVGSRRWSGHGVG
jgi:hypothetical protein